MIKCEGCLAEAPKGRRRAALLSKPEKLRLPSHLSLILSSVRDHTFCSAHPAVPSRHERCLVLLGANEAFENVQLWRRFIAAPGYEKPPFAGLKDAVKPQP
jgi:hypothetical protein